MTTYVASTQIASEAQCLHHVSPPSDLASLAKLPLSKMVLGRVPLAAYKTGEQIVCKFFNELPPALIPLLHHNDVILIHAVLELGSSTVHSIH